MENSGRIPVGVRVVHWACGYTGEGFETVDRSQGGSFPKKFFAFNVKEQVLVEVTEGMAMAGGGHGEGGRYPVVSYRFSMVSRRGDWYEPFDGSEYVYLGTKRACAVLASNMLANGENVEPFNDYAVILINKVTGRALCERVQAPDVQGAFTLAIGKRDGVFAVACLDGDLKDGVEFALSENSIWEV